MMTYLDVVSFADCTPVRARAVASALASAHYAIRLEQQKDDGNTFGDGLLTPYRTDLASPTTHYVDRGGDIVFVVDRDAGRIAGMAAIERGSFTDPEFALRRMMVTDPYRGMGLAHVIVAAALTRAAQLGATSGHLSTGFRERALQTYLDAGFVKVDEDPLPGGDCDHVCRITDLSQYA
jgi:GNAT superfamily N-acetyltransferase